jgi:hypothetical protein
MIISKHGYFSSSLEAAKICWPLFKVLLFLITPFMIIGLIIEVNLSSSDIRTTFAWQSILVFSIGALIGAASVHRMVLFEVTAQAKWNWAIVIITGLQFVLFSVVYITG